MEAESQSLRPERSSTIDWESFYRNYRKPGYVAGFEIVNKLGGGVFGMVFKARKESNGKDYAIKFLKVDDEVVRDAVNREIDSVRFFAQVDHPNLVSIEDKGEVDGIPFIVMSYAGEDTLRKRLDDGRLEREEALRVFIQAARGVQALHEHSLVHFDLKPANIFLKGDIARVGDYGLSKLVTESRNSLSFGRGTPYYMAPEMLKRRGDVRSDVYSLGVILYECLTGDVPFRGDSEWEVLRKHETEEPTFGHDVAPTERSVLRRCLAKDPEQRFQTVRDLLHALQAPASLGESLVIPPVSVRSASPSLPPPIPVQARPASVEPRPTPVRPPLPVTPRAEVVPPEYARGMGGWSQEERRGPIGGAVHLLFRAFELVILAILVPIRAISAGLGRGLAFLIGLPFRILSVALAAAGFLAVALAFVLLLVGAASLLG